MALSTTFFVNQDIVKVAQEQITMLKEAANSDPLKRARLCLHKSHDDAVQEMVIAFCRGSYIRPHRHLDKSESFHIIEGNLAVIFFDDSGRIINRIEMGSSEYGKTFLYRLNASTWHTVIPLSEYVVIHETASGPFVKKEDDYAPWAPADSDADGIRLFKKVCGG